ncbi:hypothetical protein MMC07_007707 [Pseudocyphellaria aurata]|nr:hypothetical protein [Pseudocyphellaria aurata]
MISLFASLYVVAAVECLPQLLVPSDYNVASGQDSTIAFNWNSPQTEIATSDLPTILPYQFGSIAGLEGLAQTSSILPQNPANLFSYNPQTSVKSDAPSNPADSSSSAFVSSENGLPKLPGSPAVIDTSSQDSSDPNSVYSEQGPTESDEDLRVAGLEFVIPKVVPELNIPKGGIIPSGSDVAPPVPNPNPNPGDSVDWTHIKPDDVLDDKEVEHKPDCTKLNFFNTRLAMCCNGGPPTLRGTRGTKLDLKKIGRRSGCVLWDTLNPICWSPYNRVCCFCVDRRSWAYDCYSPYYSAKVDHYPSTNYPSNPVPGPAYRIFSTDDKLAEVGSSTSPLPERARWRGRSPTAPPKSQVGQYGGSQPHYGFCPDEYLKSLGIKPKAY